MLALAETELAIAMVRHARVANRLRLEIDALHGDGELARRIERGLAARPGVTAVRADPRSGRVLIELAPGAPMLAELETLARRSRRRAARAPIQVVAPHACEASAVLAALGTTAERGLSPDEAERSLAAHGANLFESKRPPSRWALLAGQLANLPTALLLGSAAISIVLGDLVDAGAIVIVIGMNAAIGYWMERRSEELLASWRTAEAGMADVIRGGELAHIRAADLVPGDVLVVRAGNVITADARVVEAHRLAVDEAPLTGESEPVRKGVEPVARDAALADRTSMLYTGTAIATGHGRAVVVATGNATELAEIHRLAVASRGGKARLQHRLDALTSRLAVGSLVASGISALASLAWRRPPIDVLRDTVALGVAAIPEGLPVTATAALVRAMARMRARGIVVRRLGTAEALGGVTVACTDKTGTLTEGRMRLEVAWLDGHMIASDAIHGPGFGPEAGTDGTGPSRPCEGPVAALLAASVLNSDLEVVGDGSVTGSSTERALADAAVAAGLDPPGLRERYPRGRLVERTDAELYVISEHVAPDGSPIGFVKGAPEQVVPLCGGHPGALAANEMLAGEGLRVLAVGWRTDRWRLLGLVGLRDPLRRGAADAVRAAARAGIRTIMLTGDQRATAAAIARRAGLDGDVVEGRELPAVLADPARLARVAVIARVSPADKVAVVDALRAAGEIVAMAGDGINDAPALEAADVGIAVGAKSTDLARQTADVVLERADLRAILTAVAEGRIVADNLRRTIRFQVAGNLGELLLVVGGAFAGRRLISPIGLLWINLLTDTLPGLALALEPGDASVLDRPPAVPGRPILERADWRRVARDGAVIAAASGVAVVLGGPLAGFAAVGATQFGYAAACRAPGSRSTGRFATMIGGSAALHLVAVTAAPMRALLRMTGSPGAAAVSFAVAIAAPLYIAWRAHARCEITRKGVTS